MTEPDLGAIRGLVTGQIDDAGRRLRRMIARQWLGEAPRSRLNARLNASSES